MKRWCCFGRGTLCLFYLLLSALLSLAVGWMSTDANEIRRLSVEEFVRKQERRPLRRPLIVKEALSLTECDTCAQHLVSQQASTVVDLQQQQQQYERMETITTVYETTLQDALDAILFESSAGSSFLSFCEGLAVDPSLSEMTTRAREQLFVGDKDWFATYFPTTFRTTDAVVFAGVGATSTLHRDPFEWMGTSLCVEGSKVWRFIDPSIPKGCGGDVQRIDDMLEAYRLESIAWEEHGALSAGWQSNKSLFRLISPEKLPSPSDLQSMDEPTKMELFRDVVMNNYDIVSPDASILEYEQSLSCDGIVSTVVQEAGDLLLIPPHCWHQTLGLEPSAAIASQRCGSYDAPMVLQHMLDWCNADLATMDVSNPQRAVDAVLARCLDAIKSRTDNR